MLSSSTTTSQISRIPRPSNVLSVSNRTSRFSNNDGLGVNGKKTTRESAGSSSEVGHEGRLSGVVITASTISLQRASAHTRVRGEIASGLTPSPRSASVEKAIGVTTRRRKSRESTSTKGTTKSSSSSGGPISGSGLGDVLRGEGNSSSRSQPVPSLTHPNGSVNDASEKSPQIDEANDTSLSVPIAPPSAMRGRQLSPIDPSNVIKDPEQERRGGKYAKYPTDVLSGDFSHHLGAATSSTSNRFLSPVTPTFGLERRTSDSSSHGSNRDTGLNPFSDTWGQNSSVAGAAAPFEGMPTLSRGVSGLPTTRSRNMSVSSAASSLLNRSAIASMMTAREVGTSSTSLDAYTPSTASSSGVMQRTRSGSSLSKAAGVGVAGGAKKELLDQLLASLALIDSQPYSALSSLEEVDTYKKELMRTEKRIIDVQHKLKVEMRVRDAGEKLRRAGMRSRHTRTPSAASNAASVSNAPSHQRGLSIASTAAGGPDTLRPEGDALAAIKRTDVICKELIELKEKAMGLQKKLLQHQTRVLALRVSMLEEEHAGHLRAVDEQEEDDKVGANLAVEEVERTRDRLQRAEKSLKHEKRDREEEVTRWRQKLDQEKFKWKQRLEEEEQKWFLQQEEAHEEHAAAMLSLEQGHRAALEEQDAKRSAIEERLEEQLALLTARETKTKDLQNQLETLEFEMTAERNIMTERQQLFTAFERRLNRAEFRLREEDERCARLLGKLDGREEMDNMLEQIKAGYGAVKKEKTAGQDIDGLLESLAVHIGDLEDELRRGGSRTYDPSTNQDLSSQLHAVEEELQVWKSEAESVKRSLAAMQRQSTISLTSARMSTLGRSPGRSPTLQQASTFLSANASQEAEARLTLMERKNAALEAELAEVRLHGGASEQASSPPAKVPGAQGFPHMTRNSDMLKNALQELLCILPSLDPRCEDLREVQQQLDQVSLSKPKPEVEKVEDMCKEAIQRGRNVVATSGRLIQRAMASEGKVEVFETELITMEEKCEDLRSALEDLRRGNATYKAREKNLPSTVSELRGNSSLSVAVGQLCSSGSSSNGSLKGGFAPPVLVNRPSMSRGSSFSSVAASRKGKRVPQPLSIAPSSSSLSFTPTSSIPSRRLASAASSTQPKTPGSTSSSALNAPPRTMTLGMDTAQLRSRIRQLETELIHTKTKTSASGAQATTVTTTDSTDDPGQEALRQELEEYKREVDYVKGVESRQRIDLLDELTTLTSELSEARAQLRAEQRRRLAAAAER